MTTAIEFCDVEVQRWRRPLLRQVSFGVQRASIHALLGHNGAGKTTLLRALVGRIRLTAGTIRTADVPSVLFVGTTMPRELTVAQVLEHRRRMTRAEPGAVADAIARTGIHPYLDRRIAGLSTGMGQRVAIAHALVADARTVVLDEPTTGLDPQGIAALMSLLGDLRAEGRTVLICSHDLAQLELVCDEVTCLREGQVTASGSVRDVAQDLAIPGHLVRTSDDRAAVEVLRASGWRVRSTPRGVHVVEGRPLAEVVSQLAGVAQVQEATVEVSVFERIYRRHSAAPGTVAGRRRGR